MATTVSIEGLSSPGGNETRALAFLKVNYNNKEYDWQIYIPEGESVDSFFATATPIIEEQIAEKLKEWDELSPKTKEIVDVTTGQTITVPILENEIVKPDIPDYFALRKNAYPKIGDQLDALWKGSNTKAFFDMQISLYNTKIEFPKGVTSTDKLSCVKNEVWNKVLAIRQKTIEGGAKVVVNGLEKWFNSDVFSRTQWLGMVTLGDSLPPNINWRTMDGTFVILTPQLVLQVFNAVMTKEVISFGKGAALYNQIMNSDDPLAIDISTGWPDSYTPL